MSSGPAAASDAARCEVVVFDVNETLSDLSAIAPRFTEVGAPALLARTWFAGVLRDGFALTAAGSATAFADIAEAGLRSVLDDQPLDRSVDDAVDLVLAALRSLDVHPDVPAGVQALAGRGLRLVTLTNGSTSIAEGLLERAGVLPAFERLLSVEQAGTWKPAREAYEYAAHECRVDIARMLLVAVHPWDIDGAARAGMSTAWVNRRGVDYPRIFTPPTLQVAGIEEIAASVVEQGG